MRSSRQSRGVCRIACAKSIPWRGSAATSSPCCYTVSTGARRASSPIIQSLCAPYGIDRHEVVIGASIGAASAPDDANDAETLKSADTAVYRAKEEGRGTFRFFLPAMMHVEPSLLRKPAPCALARAI